MLRRRILFGRVALILRATWLIAFATPALAAGPEPVVLSNDMPATQVVAHTTYLEDPSRQLTLRDVRSPHWRAQMRSPSRDVLEFGYSSSAWWLRLEVENPGPDDAEWIVELGLPQIDHVDVYLPGRSDPGPIRMGDAVALDERPVPVLSPAFALRLDGGERQVIWARVQTTSAVSLPIRISSAVAYAGGVRRTHLYQGIVLGALGALFLYNLVVFLSTRQNAYFDYTAQMAAAIGYVLTVSGYGGLLWSGTGRFQSVIVHFFGIATCYFTLRFGRHFLGTREAIPRIDVVMRAYEWLVGACMVAVWVIPVIYAVHLLSFIGLTLALLLVVAGAVRLPTASRSMRIYLGGLGVALLAGVLALLSTAGIGPPLELSLNLLRMGFLSERIIAAMALASRIRELEHEAQTATTGQMHAEAELRETEDRLRQAQKMEAVGTLAGGIAHDFNNLLQAILGYTHMALARVKGDDQLYEDLSEVRESGERAATLTRQLLAFSRRQVLRTTDVDLNSLVENLLRMARRLLGADIEITFEPARESVVVHADPAQLEQVLLNLCVNARDAMPDGGRLSLSTSIRSAEDLRRDGLSPEDDGHYVELVVEDTGSGIPIHARDRLFEPFFTTKKEGRGTGLGLAMVYGTVRQHHGMIDVQTGEGGGSVFRIQLPIVERPAESTPIIARETEAARGDECLLVAEDDRQVRTLTAQMLSSSGYRVLACEDGLEALELFDAHRDAIQLAVLDLVMPQMGGRRVAEEIRRQSPDLPILFCTGYDSSGARQGLDLDARTVLLQKPYRQNELLSAVRGALNATQPDAAPIQR